MYRPLPFTLAVTASAILLSGCAGMNALTEGELINPLSQLLPHESVSQAQTVQQSPANMGSTQTQTNVIVNGSGPIVAALPPSDPINAPPPPINQNGNANQDVGQNSSTVRPMMLVPSPGSDVLQNSRSQSRIVEPNVTLNVNTEGLNQVINNDGRVREFTPLAVMPMQEEQETTIITSENTLGHLRQREFIPAALSQTGMVSLPIQPGDIPLSKERLNSIQRFEILDRLLKDGLLARQEYDLRRSENLGVLLPFTSAKPAVGLGREVPSSEAISSRLSALRRSIELRAITPRQHSIERNMILDALLPRNPIARESTMPPPADVIQAAATVGHLESLRMAGLISDDEFENERLAIDQYLAAGSLLDGSGMAAVPSDESASENEQDTLLQGPQMGLHLASYRTESAAQTGWDNLNSKFTNELQGLSPVIRRVNLGEAQGTFYRLLAAPVPSTDRANTLCQRLKRSDQYCDPLRIDG